MAPAGVATKETIMRSDPFLTGTIGRRELLALGAGVFVVGALPAAIARRTALVRRTVPVMGTIASVQVAHHDERAAEDAIDAALYELTNVEATMSRFRADSDIGRANLGAARDAVPVTAATALVVRAALEWAGRSDGRFDPALGSVSELWDVLNRHEPPQAERVKRLERRGFWKKVDVGTLGGSPVIRYEDRDVQLDLGAIAKGYAIDRAAGALRERGMEHAIVTVGGDLYAIGGSPDGGPWQVGIRDPHDLTALAGSLEVRDRAVATSGDYERFFRWRGMRYHHLMDPLTAAPRITAVHSVTVTASRAIDADAASTSVFGLAREPALAAVRRFIPDAVAIPLT
jgi:thiamine biosynthesis lipoprotein